MIFLYSGKQSPQIKKSAVAHEKIMSLRKRLINNQIGFYEFMTACIGVPEINDLKGFIFYRKS